MVKNNKSNMQALWDSSMLDAGSAAWVEGLYEVFLRDPNDVESHWRNYFETLPRVNGSADDIPHEEILIETMPVPADPYEPLTLECKHCELKIKGEKLPKWQEGECPSGELQHEFMVVRSSDE